MHIYRAILHVYIIIYICTHIGSSPAVQSPTNHQPTGVERSHSSDGWLKLDSKVQIADTTRF